MAPWQHRVGKRLNIIVAVACALLVVLIWLSTLQRTAFEREQAIEAAMQSNSNLAIAFEQQVVRTLRAAEQVAAFVREQYLVHRRAIRLEDWVESGVIRESLFTVVSIVDETGAVVDSSLGVLDVNYADRAFFTAQIDNEHDTLYVNAPVTGRVSGQTRVPMSLRITRPDGSFGGVVVLSVEPAAFTDFYSSADLGTQGLLELTGDDGVVRARKVGRDTTHGHSAQALSWYAQHQTRPAGSFVDDGAAVDGVSRIVSYRSVAGYPLLVAVGTAYADELAPVMQRRAVYLTLAVAGSLGLIAFALLFVLLATRQRQANAALQTSEALYRATFHQAATGIAHIAPDGHILGANEKFCAMLGYDEATLRNMSILDLSEPENRQSVCEFIKQRLAVPSTDFSSEIEKAYRRRDGSRLWVCEALGVVRDGAGNPDFLVAVTQDITARKELEARLLHDAMHDSLTRLPNRNLFHDRLAQVLAAARRHGRMAAVLYLDLDGFKLVNDAHGHAIGDVLLQQVAGRLRRSVRAEDLVARFSGDEFGVVLESLTSPDDARCVAEKLVRTLSRPFEIDDVTARISASVGAAVFPDDGSDPATLVARADAAMYEAKRRRYERVRQGQAE